MQLDQLQDQKYILKNRDRKKGGYLSRIGDGGRKLFRTARNGIGYVEGMANSTYKTRKEDRQNANKAANAIRNNQNMKNMIYKIIKDMVPKNIWKLFKNMGSQNGIVNHSNLVKFSQRQGLP